MNKNTGKSDLIQMTSYLSKKDRNDDSSQRNV